MVSHQERLLERALGLMETGAFGNSSDALTSSATLLELLARQPDTRVRASAEEVQRVLMQVCGRLECLDAGACGFVHALCLDGLYT